MNRKDSETRVQSSQVLNVNKTLKSKERKEPDQGPKGSKDENGTKKTRKENVMAIRPRRSGFG